MADRALVPLPRWAALLVNIVGYQAGWTACVLSATHDEPMIGVAVVAGLLGLHLLFTPAVSRDLLLALVFGIFGFAADSLLGLLNVVVYGGAGVWAWLAPPWLVAIWALFATTMHVTFPWLMVRPGLAAVLGAVAGAAAYLGGARLGAVSLLVSEPVAALAFGIEWALAFPLLLILARSVEAQRRLNRAVRRSGASAARTSVREQRS